MMSKAPVKPGRKPRRKLRMALMLSLLLVLIGCRSAGYYGQAIHGQCRLLLDRQPIKSLLDTTNTPPALKDKLRRVQEIRAFAARELGLPVEGHYVSYVDVKREHVVWNVKAAPEFSLDAHTWWYPFVGRLKYRGYFAEADARAYAAKLQQEGFDTHVGGVDAYSTLGWFKDPVISTFIDYDDADLAGVVFHELAHQKLFAGGDSDFDEAFAMAVEQEGVRRWLKSTGRVAALAEYERELKREVQFQALLERTRAELRALYTSPASLQASQGKVRPDQLAQLRADKQAVFDRLRQQHAELRVQWDGAPHRLRWVTNQVNNAKLAGEATYHRLLPAFQNLLAQNQNDLNRFYAAAKKLADLPPERREEAMVNLLKQSALAAE